MSILPAILAWLGAAVLCVERVPETWPKPARQSMVKYAFARSFEARRTVTSVRQAANRWIREVQGDEPPEGYGAARMGQPCPIPHLCWDKGLCTIGANGRCTVDWQSCQRSNWCESIGTCAPDMAAGRCTSTAAYCATWPGCRESGTCAAGMPGTGCEATAAGCARSERCAVLGWCKFDGLFCKASEAGCANSETCKRHGECRFDHVLTRCIK